MAFAGDRLVVAAMTGMRQVESAKVLADVYVVRTLGVKAPFEYAGVAQSGKYFALQEGTESKERFGIYSVETGQRRCEMRAKEMPEVQSWTAFSPDGTLFAVGSPLKLTLYRFQ